MAVVTPPLERLPAEVVCQVVAIYLRQNESITIITQICRNLRLATFEMSFIWRTIRLLTTEYPGGSQYRYADVRTLVF
jgi:hypothetical protein